MSVNTGSSSCFRFSINATAPNSAKAVIQYSDKEAGTINAKGIVVVFGLFGIPMSINFSLIIDVKDSQARLTFKALSVETTVGTNHNTVAVNSGMAAKFKEQADAMTKDYEQFMKETKSGW
jgi:hypothetical protein